MCFNLIKENMPGIPKTTGGQPITESHVGKTKIDTYLTQIRNLCRARGLQIWNKQSLSDLIYQDLLFLYHIPRLCREKILTIDIEFIGRGKITEPSFAQLLTLGDNEAINAGFKRLWAQLQLSEVKVLFDREFPMFPIEKNVKTQKKYYDLLIDLFRYSASVDLESYDSNAGFTYFKKGLNKTTAKVFGQFYTPSSVQKSVVTEVNPSLTDIVLDPSCGSCSFIQESTEYLIKLYNVSPKIAIKNLHGIEVEPNIYTEGIMNMFINFGVLPDMENNIREADAFLTLLDDDTKVDKIVANPPFGADATTFFEHYFITTFIENGKRQKKTTIINPEIKVHIPHTNTKESAILFFQIIVQKLKSDGKAGVVMNGSIFNEAHSEMIHWFLDTCNLTKIIINPPGTFKDQGTNIETYSFIYTKGAPTTTINVVMLGDEDTSVREITYDQVKDAGWRIKVKLEDIKEIYTGNHVMRRLGDIIKYHSATNTVSTNDIIPGDYMMYSSSKETYTHNAAEFKCGEDNPLEYLIQGSRGTISKATYVASSDFSVSNNVFVISMLDSTQYILKFVYYSLILSEIADKTSQVAVIPMLTKTMFNSIELPFPSVSTQELIVSNLDRMFANINIMTDMIAFTDKSMDLMLKDPTGTTLEQVLNGLRLKRKYAESIDSIKQQMAAIMKSVGTCNHTQLSIKDVCEHKNGITLDKESKDDNGAYNVMGGGMDYVGRYTNYNREGYTITISKSGASSGFVKEHHDKFWAGDCFSIFPKSDSLNHRYLYYILKLDPTITTSKITGSTIPHCKWSDICDSLIAVPSITVQQEILTILEEMDSECSTLEQFSKKTEERSKHILDTYLL
jgi:restriction endonuclease S subunit